ncbi:Uncharacterized protein Rs2_33806 [Raphanus sativus]|nr:Uncharacterized protein Rs2_33806 [Raphanus sativus]
MVVSKPPHQGHRLIFIDSGAVLFSFSGGSALPLGSGGFFSLGFAGFCLREAGVYLAPSSPAIIRVLRSLRSMKSLAYLYSASQSLSGAASRREQCWVWLKGVVPDMNPPPTESRRVAVSEAGGRRMTFVGTRGD